MTQDAQQRASRIPAFGSIEEKAGFWDTRDLTVYLDEFTPVQIHVSPNLTSVFSVHLDPQDHEEVARRAQEAAAEA